MSTASNDRRPLPTPALPGWAVHQSQERPPTGAWPARRQLLYLPAGARSPDALLRVDIFAASDAADGMRLLTLLRGEVHAAEARQVQPEQLADGSWRWHWRGVWILGRAGVVAMVRNAGTESRPLDEVARALEAALGQTR